jgi:hypothetical protein
MRPASGRPSWKSASRATSEPSAWLAQKRRSRASQLEDPKSLLVDRKGGVGGGHAAGAVDDVGGGGIEGCFEELPTAATQHRSIGFEAQRVIEPQIGDGERQSAALAPARGRSRLRQGFPLRATRRYDGPRAPWNAS